MVITSLNNEKWYMGNVLWYGGYNNKTGKENQFGFLLSEKSNELFFHKKNIIGKSLPSGGSVVLFQEKVGKNGKNEAFNVQLLDIKNEATSNHLIKYLKIFIADKRNYAQWKYRDNVVSNLIEFYSNNLKEKFISAGIALVDIFPLFFRVHNYEDLFLFFFSDTDFNNIVGKQIQPDLMPSLFIDNNIKQLSVWLRKHIKDDCIIDDLGQDITKSLLEKISLSAILYLAFYHLIDASVLLKHRHNDIKEFVQRSFTKKRIKLHSFMRDAYYHNFSLTSQYYADPIINLFAKPLLIKRKIYKRDLSFIYDIESDEELSTDPEFFILGKLLPLIGHNDESVIQKIILHEIWHAILTGRISINHPSIFNLFPQCSSLQRRFSSIALSCEAFHWTVKQSDGTIEEMFLCRSKKCEYPQVIPDPNREYINFTIYDWLAHYNLNYIVADKPSKQDFAIKLAGYFNRIRELYLRLNCRTCGMLMIPDMKYARIEAYTWDIQTKTMMKKPVYAAYRLTVFKCANKKCKEHAIGHYINHCIGYKCSEIIDDRDLTERCSEGRFICKFCGSCCRIHQNKFGNVNNGESEEMKYRRLYQNSPYYSKK